MSLNAAAKRDIQWNQIVGSQYDWNYLPTAFAEPTDNLTLQVQPSNLAISFTWKCDEMPAGRTRTIISPFAVNLKVIFRTFKNSSSQFTGVFHSAFIMRLALDAIRSKTTLDNYGPTMATKIYIDGKRSQNFLAGHDLIGQGPDRNYFRDQVFNILPPGAFDPSDPISMGFQASILILAQGEGGGPIPGNSPQYEASQVDSSGNNVTNPIAPFRLIFTPNPALALPADDQRDFRIQLRSIVKPGGLIYTVSALRTQNATLEEPVGQLICDSDPLPSAYGAKTIFFRHPRTQWRP